MLQRIRERARWNDEAIERTFNTEVSRTRTPLGNYCDGAFEQRKQLLPLIDALIQAVEVSDKALKEIVESSDFSQDFARDARASMQSILEKAVAK